MIRVKENYMLKFRKSNKNCMLEAVNEDGDIVGYLTEDYFEVTDKTMFFNSSELYQLCRKTRELIVTYKGDNK